jgi:hypothetical protein
VFLMARTTVDAFKELDITFTEMFQLTAARISDPVARQTIDGFIDYLKRMGIDDTPPFFLSRHPVAALDEAGHCPLCSLIERLFAEAPKMPSRPGEATQAPAVECIVTMPSGGSLQGVLSLTPDGLCRMMSPGIDEKGAKIMVEHFFQKHDITVISVKRDVVPVPRLWPA